MLAMRQGILVHKVIAVYGYLNIFSVYLQGILQNGQQTSSITCPLCRKVSSVTGDVDQLPNNSYALYLVSVKAKKLVDDELHKSTSKYGKLILYVLATIFLGLMFEFFFPHQGIKLVFYMWIN